jgi:hypothetical protein
VLRLRDLSSSHGSRSWMHCSCCVDDSPQAGSVSKQIVVTPRSLPSCTDPVTSLGCGSLTRRMRRCAISPAPGSMLRCSSCAVGSSSSLSCFGTAAVAWPLFKRNEHHPHDRAPALKGNRKAARPSFDGVSRAHVVEPSSFAVRPLPAFSFRVRTFRAAASGRK